MVYCPVYSVQCTLRSVYILEITTIVYIIQLFNNNLYNVHCAVHYYVHCTVYIVQ